MIQKVMGFLAEESGATAVDYATIGALAAVGLFGVVDILGQDAVAGLTSVSAGAETTGSSPFDCGLVCGKAE